LDVGLGFHHKSVHGELTDQRFHSFITVHTIGHPVEQMMSLTGVIMGGGRVDTDGGAAENSF
jgi:hypothetical protein